MFKVTHLAVFALLFCGVFPAIAEPPTPPPGTDVTRVLIDILAMVGPQQGAGPLRVQPGEKIAVMGDSITQHGGYVRLTKLVLDTKYPALQPTIINAGISGHRSDQMDPRFEKDMRLAEKPETIFINAGINDMYAHINAPFTPADLAVYATSVTSMVNKAQASGARVVLLTPTIFYEDPRSELNRLRLQRYTETMQQIAAEQKCEIVDLHALFLTVLEKKPATMNLLIDYAHMSLYGDAIMAIGVLRALGVSDAEIASVDIVPALCIRGMEKMPLTRFAALLQIPPDQCLKPALVKQFCF